MPKFMLFLHEDPGQFAGRTHDQMMATIKEYSAWAASMRERGCYQGGEKLTDDSGRVLRPKSGATLVTDGPYAESKEIVGGYFSLSAANYDEAVSLAKTCPHLKYGGRIEVRQVHEF